MNEILVIKLVFGIFLTLGAFVLFFLSFRLFYKYLLQEKRCTSNVKGTIKKYTWRSHGDSGIYLPVVVYHVNGKDYKVTGPEYKGYRTITRKSPVSKNEMEYDEKNQILTVKRNINSIVGNYKNPIAELYPVNTEIEVYYDPQNPKLSYVLRYCNKKFSFYLTFCSGIVILICDVLILMI